MEKSGREQFSLRTSITAGGEGNGGSDDRKIAPVPIFPATWGTGSYSPTPTIIEAARSLYARHTVHDITRSDAGAVNLAATSGCIERIIAAAKAGRRKAIVFVTGVPGAGKTLVGLNVATRHGERSDAAHAVFLFGKARWWRCCGRPWPATTSIARGRRLVASA